MSYVVQDSELRARIEDDRLVVERSHETIIRTRREVERLRRTVGETYRLINQWRTTLIR